MTRMSVISNLEEKVTFSLLEIMNVSDAERGRETFSSARVSHGHQQIEESHRSVIVWDLGHIAVPL